MDALNGLISLPWWGYVLVALGLTHVTIASVTIYLHRHQAHRALDLHPLPSHFFRFWLWLTTGMVTRQWVAVHRKHHAHCEREEDPHSPQQRGLREVLFRGAELYRKEAADARTIERYRHGTPDDWIERHVYMRNGVGISLMLVINLVLFGPIGLTIWAVQMLWIPFWAAGVVNGLGHYWGYRNFDCEDASTNLVPWGIIIGGEELHNNHHSFATSARMSARWYEFDIGWAYICVLSWLRLATVRRVMPKVRFDRDKQVADLGTVEAIITHRYVVMREYVRTLRKRCRDEIERMVRDEAAPVDARALRRFVLSGDERGLSDVQRARMTELVARSTVLTTMVSMRQELAHLWSRSNASAEQLLEHLTGWIHRAERSGIHPLTEFSLRLRQFAI